LNQVTFTPGERVADRLFEREGAVLHVIERIVAALGLRVDARSPWVDARLPDGSRVQTRFLGTLFSGLGPLVLVAELCRQVQIGFPGAGFRGLQANLVLDAAAPLERLPEAIPERLQVANPRSI
jgi:hypothetical protein